MHIYCAQESRNTSLLASRALPYLRNHDRAGAQFKAVEAPVSLFAGSS